MYLAISGGLGPFKGAPQPVLGLIFTVTLGYAIRSHHLIPVR
jgi:hypothetical protein